MEILRDKDRELYDKLVRLAGGNSSIVIRCLSNRKRRYVTLKDLIEEIKGESYGSYGKLQGSISQMEWERARL